MARDHTSWCSVFSRFTRESRNAVSSWTNQTRTYIRAGKRKCQQRNRHQPASDCIHQGRVRGANSRGSRCARQHAFREDDQRGRSGDAVRVGGESEGCAGGEEVSRLRPQRRVMMKFMQPGTRRTRARVTMRWAIVTRLGRRVLVDFLGNAHRTDERGVALRVLGKVRRTMQLA